MLRWDWAQLKRMDRAGSRTLLSMLATRRARGMVAGVAIGYDHGWWHRYDGYSVPDGLQFCYNDGEIFDWPDELKTHLADAQDYWFVNYVPKEGDCIVDIGAGRGEDVIAFSRAVGRRGKVFAIEAHPENYRRLASFVRLNGLANVTPIHVALADEAKDVFIDDADSWIDHNTLSATQGTKVRAQRFDDLRRQYDIADIDYLKMNIEGAERFALAGMPETLKDLNDICVCAHDFRADRGEAEFFRTRDFVQQTLGDAGFHVFNRADDDRDYVRDHLFGTRKSRDAQAV